VGIVSAILIMYKDAMEKEPKTVIDVAKNLAEVVASRDITDILKPLIENTDTRLVDLDFKNTSAISRSAAHELLLIKEDLARAIAWKKEISFINTNKDIESMLRVIAANRALPKTEKATPKIQKTDLKSLLREVCA